MPCNKADAVPRERLPVLLGSLVELAQTASFRSTDLMDAARDVIGCLTALASLVPGKKTLSKTSHRTQQTAAELLVAMPVSPLTIAATYGLPLLTANTKHDTMLKNIILKNSAHNRFVRNSFPPPNPPNSLRRTLAHRPCQLKDTPFPLKLIPKGCGLLFSAAFCGK